MDAKKSLLVDLQKLIDIAREKKDQEVGTPGLEWRRIFHRLSLAFQDIEDICNGRDF